MPDIPPIGQPFDRDAVLQQGEEYHERRRRFAWLRDHWLGIGGCAPWTGDYRADSGAPSDATVTGETYLRKYGNESASKWQNRYRASVYKNYVEKVITVYTGMLTKTSPNREHYPDDVLDELEHLTRQGDSWDTVMGDSYIPTGIALGEHFILVDRGRKVTGPGASAAESPDTDIYCDIIQPDSVLDLILDEDGELLEIKWAVDIVIKESTVDARHRKGQRVWVFNTAGWYYFDVYDDDDDNMVRVTESGVWQSEQIRGRVPVVWYRNTDLARSVIWSIVQVADLIYQQTSWITEYEELACYPRLVWPARNPDEIKDLNFGTATAVPFPHDGKQKPEFIELDTGPHERLAESIAANVQELKFLASLTNEGSSGTTGIALAYGLMSLDRTLAGIVTSFERLEGGVCDLIARWLGDDGMPDDAVAGYPRSFDLVELREALEAVSVGLDMGMPAEVRASMKKYATGKVLRDLPEEDRQKMMDAIEALEEAAGDEQPPELEPLADDGLRALDEPDIEGR